MKKIIITGSVGTGKSTIAKSFSKKIKYPIVDISNLVHKNKLYEGFDKKRKTKIVDTDKLNKFLVLEIKKAEKSGASGIIIDGHLSHYLPRKYVDLCIVAKCSLKEIERRLKRRGYDKKKIRENLDVEIFDICLEEAKKMGHKIKIVDTTPKLRIFRKIDFEF